MIKHPPLLILDEPTAALNETGAALIVSLINKIAASRKTTIIYVSHRAEYGLKMDFTFELIKSEFGSKGEICTS